MFALALLVTTGYGMQKSIKSDANLSALALSNVEVLANGEFPDPTVICIHDCIVCGCYIPPIGIDPNGYWVSNARSF